MNKAHRERLEKLADFLDTVEEKYFDIREWMERKPHCKTVACAAGWACKIKEFNKDGLKAKKQQPTFEPVKPEDQNCYLSGVYQEASDYDDKVIYRGYNAVSAFFGLSYNKTRQIFDPGYYLSGSGVGGKVMPKDVTKKIRILLQEETGA